MQCIEDDTMTPAQLQWLTWGAIQHRPAGAPKWDEPGTAKAIADHCGTWGLAIATEHVLAHARDPKAKTPFVIKGPTPHTEPVKASRQPAKAGGDECPVHPGEYAAACRACAADRLAGDESSQPHRHKPPADVAQRGAAACRAGLRAPEPSPAPDVAASAEPPAPPAVSSADEGDDHGPASAGEPDRPEVTPATHVWGERGPEALVPRRVDDRPETACVADGCYRPTRDGICERCRAAAIAEDIDAGNAALIAQLKDQQRHRPAPTPSAPNYFTSAHYDPERVHAAQARAAEKRSST